jgi:hypothetical protein
MEGVYIAKSRGGPWASLAALAASLSLLAAVLWGPFFVGVFSAAGLCMALIGLILAYRAPTLEKPVVFPWIMVGTHLVLLAAAAVLQSMFLSPLPAESRKIPKLQTPFTDANGVFECKGPAGWDVRPVPSSLESGVRLQPGDESRYMGVSEMTVFVRRLDNAPASDEEFLRRAADAFSEKRGGEKKLFDLRTEKGRSLRGAPVMWSELTIKRYWVPIYQISLFGIKNKRYLCSVSATGLKSHADLSRLLCLGLFERINVTDKHGS